MTSQLDSTSISGARKPWTQRVVHFQRKPTTGHFSVESHFAELRDLLSPRVDVTVEIMPRLSRRVLPRVQNMVAARMRQGDVNHIVGDSHYLATLLDPARTILTILDCDVLQRTSGLRRALLKLFWFTIPAKRVAAITVISEATRQEVNRHIDFPLHKIHVIPVFNNNAFQYCPREFNTERPTILQVGTRHNKNLERLILALEDISCRLIITGILTCEQRRLLDQTKINYENHQNLTATEIVSCYQQCDMLSFASTNEGFGMPILEAQSVGRPVVTSNCASMPEVAGNAAALVDPFSVDDIRQTIRRVIADAGLRSELVERGLENVRRYAPARITDQYCALYDSFRR